MENLPEGTYRICFELARTANKDYPMGDDILDEIESDIISVTTNAEYGLRIDTAGKMALGINIADLPQDTVSNIDFNVLVNSTLAQEVAESKSATVRFEQYKKDKTSGVYMPYNGSKEIKLNIDYASTESSAVLGDTNYDYAVNGIAGINAEPSKINCSLDIPYDADITNYKVQAQLYIDGEKQATDFFIFNISDIKH